LIDFPGVFVARLIGVTVRDGKPLMAYAVFPSRVITIASGGHWRLIGLPAVLVARSIGCTAWADVRLLVNPVAT
jgi:hypothetical protein